MKEWFNSVILLVSIVFFLNCLGCVVEPAVQSVTKDGDTLSVAIIEEEYSILSLGTDGSIAVVDSAVITLECFGTVTEPMSSKFEGNFELVSDLLKTPGEASMSGLKQGDNWMLTVSFLVKQDDGQWAFDRVKYQIYGGSDPQKDGLLIVIIGHGDQIHYAVKGNNPKDAVKRYEKLWEEVFFPVP